MHEDILLCIDDEDTVEALRAYLPKKPGNFGQHFLDTCHGNRSLSGVGLHHIHMERAPRRFFSEKVEKS